MKKLFSGLILTLAVFMFYSFTPKADMVLPEDPGVEENFRYPIFLPDFPVCGDIVNVEGMVHIVTNVTFGANGSFHLKMHNNTKGNGVSLITGAKYQWNDAINESVNMMPGETRTFHQRLRIIGQGKAPNFKLDATHHITINAKGDVTVEFGDFKEECK